MLLGPATLLHWSGPLNCGGVLLEKYVCRPGERHQCCGPGVIYAGLTATERSEHGGFGHDDTNVPILLSMLADEGKDGAGQRVLAPVTTAQVAPTILAMLGLDPTAIDAVRAEGTRPLPGSAE